MNYNDLCISENYTVRSAIEQIDKTGRKILVVTNHKGIVVGVVTDGDIRRWILKAGNLEENVSEIMNKNPTLVYSNNLSKAKQLMKENLFTGIPVINHDGQFSDMIFWDDFFEGKPEKKPKFNTPVVIMAGGKGTRLLPYTAVIPKPLIPIGETPIIQRIINRFLTYGCLNYYITVNYKKNMIKAFFSEKSDLFSIDYIEEDKPLGTAGSLFFLKNKLKETFFVTNSDILIDCDYNDLLAYHKNNANVITMVTALKHFQIPYGTVSIKKNGQVKSILEKPKSEVLVNTGMYILEPECLDFIEQESFIHITDLIENCLSDGRKVGTYPVMENDWLDMGQLDEMERMKKILGVDHGEIDTDW